MNRLQELMDELCPDGVPYRPLGVVAPFVKTKAEISDFPPAEYIGVENLNQNFGGIERSFESPNSGKGTAFIYGDILLGNIRPYLKKMWCADSEGLASNDVLVIRISKDINIKSKFLYYVLCTHEFVDYNIQNSRGGKMPRGNKQAILKYKIPVPPLKIQNEIVRILDSFTLLEAELEARKKQYAFYREKLLNFDGLSSLSSE